MRRTLFSVVGIAVTVAVVILAVAARVRPPYADEAPVAMRLAAAGSPTTSREDLIRTIDAMERRLRSNAHDREASLLLSEALVRQARVTGRATLTRRAVEIVEPVVRRDPADYEARRMLATAYAADHRFRDALREAQRARDVEPRDPWSHGIIGDSHLELGEYADAFTAFERMVTLKPSAASYSRVSYGFEIQGQLEDAIRAMTLAVDAAHPRDPEAMAWLHAQLAELYLQVGRVPEARRQLAWGERAFPGHPFVRHAIARVKEWEGDLHGALAMYREQFDTAETPDLAAAIGDLYDRLGRRQDAERHYARAESLWRSGGEAERDYLARFLADHGRKIPDAVILAEQGAASATDIVAKDALAWVYFKAGRLQEADRAATDALRTGTRNSAIVYHAAAIRAALGRAADARALLQRLPPRAVMGGRLRDSIARLRAQLDGAQQAARE